MSFGVSLRAEERAARGGRDGAVCNAGALALARAVEAGPAAASAAAAGAAAAAAGAAGAAGEQAGRRY